MKEVIQSKIFLVVICGILFTSLGAYAANYLASDVSYTKDGVQTNVNDALDDLYGITKLGDASASDIASGKTAVVQGDLITGTAQKKSVEAVQYGGQYANLSSTTFSLTGIPNYNKLVLNKNLFVRVSIVQGNNNGLSNQQSYVNISYNASSGTLTVQNSYNGCFVYFYVYYIPQE